MEYSHLFGYCISVLVIWACIFITCKRIRTLRKTFDTKTPSTDTEIIEVLVSACARVSKVIAFLTSTATYMYMYMYMLASQRFNVENSCRNLRERILFYYSSALATWESAIITNKYAIYRYISVVCRNYSYLLENRLLLCALLLPALDIKNAFVFPQYLNYLLLQLLNLEYVDMHIHLGMFVQAYVVPGGVCGQLECGKAWASDEMSVCL